MSHFNTYEDKVIDCIFKIRTDFEPLAQTRHIDVSTTDRKRAFLNAWWPYSGLSQSYTPSTWIALINCQDGYKEDTSATDKAILIAVGALILGWVYLRGR